MQTGFYFQSTFVAVSDAAESSSDPHDQRQSAQTGSQRKTSQTWRTPGKMEKSREMFNKKVPMHFEMFSTDFEDYS